MWWLEWDLSPRGWCIWTLGPWLIVLFERAMEVLGHGAWLEDVQQRALRVYSHTLLSVFVHTRLFLPPPFSCPPCALLQPVSQGNCSTSSGIMTLSPTRTIRENTTELYCGTEQQLTLRDLKLFKLIIILPQKLYHLIWWSSKRINKF